MQLVTPMRFELMASGLGILRSILLSYGVAACHIANAGRGANHRSGGTGGHGTFLPMRQPPVGLFVAS